MLTDEAIERITADIGLQEPFARWKIARAIESAATASLLARIAELTRQLEEARKDAMHAAALICDALPAPPSCNVLERSLWDVATVAAADAIRAAIKDQT